MSDADEIRAEYERKGMPTEGVDFDLIDQLQKDGARRVPGWEAPRVLPSNWRESDRQRDGSARYVSANMSLIAILSCSIEADGRAWLHLSVSHRKRIPTHGEMRVVKELFLCDREAYSVIPPRERYVNLHPNVLHLFALIDEKLAALPDFTAGTGSL